MSDEFVYILEASIYRHFALKTAKRRRIITTSDIILLMSDFKMTAESWSDTLRGVGTTAAS